MTDISLSPLEETESTEALLSRSCDSVTEQDTERFRASGPAALDWDGKRGLLVVPDAWRPCPPHLAWMTLLGTVLPVQGSRRPEPGARASWRTGLLLLSSPRRGVAGSPVDTLRDLRDMFPT